MGAGHAFIDTAGARVSGKAASLFAWEGFFRQFPDYQNVFEQVVAREGQVAIRGHSICSDVRLHGPALWSAMVAGGKVLEWRVYEDSTGNRRRLGLAGDLDEERQV
jgi:hypothetical protein